VQLTESQAWQKIGEAFEAKAAHPDLEVDPEMDIADTGLCAATYRIRRFGDISAIVENQMDWKSNYEVQKQGRASVYLQPGPYEPEGIIDRAALAYLFAAETA
jgi:hypothetical protein